MMKTLRILTVILLSISLSACITVVNPPVASDSDSSSESHSEAGPYKVTYVDPQGETIAEAEVRTPDEIYSFPPPDMNIDGRALEFYRWLPEIDETAHTITAKALYTETISANTTNYRNQDVFRDTLRADMKNQLLVIHISFKDEPAINRQEFENLFTGDYDADNALYSVGSYFRQTSYGGNLLDFTFVYYDCTMTVEEAWHYVNDEDEYGSYIGNRFLFDIFDELKAAGAIDTTKLDADGNGFVDGTLFILGDRPSVDDCYIYGGAQGHTGIDEYTADPLSPSLGKYLKVSADYCQKPLRPASGNHEGTRMLIHEIGHLFGLVDYYDTDPLDGEIIDSLGGFDMQSGDTGDWNPFSRFSCGWLTPYVITEDMDSVTLKLRCSSLYSDAILIPTSKGWNGTAFDEYILVDVMAPACANGFDWEALTYMAERGEEELKNAGGGVRILHVDARLVQQIADEYIPVDDPASAIHIDAPLFYAHANSNGPASCHEPAAQFFHQIDWVPSDGSSKIRLCTPTYWSAFTFASTNDLFGTGSVFSASTHRDAFPNSELMNNGGTLDYELTVEYYDDELSEAVVTVKKIR